ncbi:hypothetical protein Poli38472_009957 [Pythium oligandrum]|uniref:Uncharacterized protein n=1 Tax=Pythium oligandrum TaxID=41045 RepID=A0A8K1C8K0_PYTOL|nr:hypothetical protein Poli38472_009957 [Pythium oligandrum]|eukprot:TMW58398.1 hypothetical protein Poli38472_009957 [Pythium oligandrum]
MEASPERLVHAVQSGDIEAVQEILNERPELVAFRDQADNSLVHLAVKSEHLDILAVVLSAGASLAPENDAGQTAMRIAIEAALGGFVRLLLTYGGDVNALDSDGQSLLHLVAMYNVIEDDVHLEVMSHALNLDVRDANGNTPLHLAAAYESLEVTIALIDAGADVNARNDYEATPLHLAAPNGYDTIVQLLIQHGADVNAVDSDGNTPLITATFVTQSAVGHFACGDPASQANVVNRLLEKEAAIDSMNRNGDTALFGAVRNDFGDVVTKLLASGASSQHVNRREETVLHVAARANVLSVNLWSSLLLTGVDVAALDRFERSCYSIWVSRPKIVVEEDGENPVEASEPAGLTHEEHITQLLEAALLRQTMPPPQLRIY